MCSMCIEMIWKYIFGDTGVNWTHCLTCLLHTALVSSGRMQCTQCDIYIYIINVGVESTLV